MREEMLLMYVSRFKLAIPEIVAGFRLLSSRTFLQNSVTNQRESGLCK